ACLRRRYVVRRESMTQRCPYTTLFRSAATRMPAAREPGTKKGRDSSRPAGIAWRPRQHGARRAVGEPVAAFRLPVEAERRGGFRDRKSTRLNSRHVKMSYAVLCLK